MVMRETLDGFQGGLEIGGRMITNVRYADRLDRVSRKYVDKTKILWCSRALCISILRFVI